MATLNQETLDLANALRTAMVALRTLVNGNQPTLTALATSDKTSLVAAVNELQAALVASGGGGGTFAALTDKATADLPAINGPLTNALSFKANLADLPALTYAGTNPNQPQTIIVGGGALTDGINPVVFPPLIFAGYTFGGTAPMYTNHGGEYGLADEYYLAYDEAWELVKVAGGVVTARWVDGSLGTDVYDIYNNFDSQGAATGGPYITVVEAVIATHLGQFCKASDGWWKWNGSAWEEEVGGGTSDHGALTGLGDDDHSQYFNQSRGDARYTPTSTLESTYAPIANPTFTGNATADQFNTFEGGGYSTSGIQFLAGLGPFAVNFSAGDPTAVRNLNLPDASGTVAVTSRSDGKIVATDIAGILPITSGGTGGSTQGTARAALGVAVTVPTTSSGTTIALSSTNTVRAGVQVRASNAAAITATVNAADSALIPGDQWDILAVGTGQLSVAGATTTRNKTATSSATDYQGVCVTLDTIGGGTATVTVVGGVA